MIGAARFLKAFAVVAVLAAATACAPAEQGVTQAQAGEAVIVLSEGECDQQCPVYDMTLHPDGSYALHGVIFVKTAGVSEGRIGKAAWTEAEKALTDAGFWTMPANQTSNASQNCQPGAPTVHITWRTDTGKQKTITYTAGCGARETHNLVIALREAMAFGDLVWTEDRFAPDGSR